MNTGNLETGDKRGLAWCIIKISRNAILFGKNDFDEDKLEKAILSKREVGEINVEYHEEEQSQQMYVQPSKASTKSNAGSTTRIPLSSFKFRLPSMDSVTYDKPQKRTHTSRSNVNNVNQFLDEALGMVLSSTSSH